MTVITNPLLLKKKAAAGGGDSDYQIEKSLRFNSGDSAYLSRTPSSTGNQKIWTWSGWIKRTELGLGCNIFGANSASSDTGYLSIHFGSDDTITSSGAGTIWRITNQKFRDPSAWYHLVFVADTSNAIADERFRWYCNGKRITSFSTNNAITQNNAIGINTAGIHTMSRYPTSGGHAGYMSADVQFIDGLALSPAAFGSFDSNTGVWNPKAFALPAPNTNKTWSGMLTSETGTFESGGSPANLFDSNPTTTGVDDTNQGKWLKFTPTDGLAFSNSIRVYNNGQEQTWEVKLTDGTVKETKTDSAAYHTIYEGGGTLEYIKDTAASGDYNNWFSIEVDGVSLVDGQTDKTYTEEKAVSYLNDGTTFLAGSAAFDGVATTDSAGNAHLTGVNGTVTITFPKTITVATSLKLQMYASWANFNNHCDVFVNGTEVTMSQDTAGGDNHGIWASNFTGDMTELKFTAKGNASQGVAQVIVDGTILVNGQNDGVGTNSFHLKFNDTSFNRYLGKDTLNGKIADATGGKPLLATTDDYGLTLGSGNATDSFSSDLKFAFAGNNVTGSSLDISGSGHSCTVTNGTLDTTQSHFYGSSVNFDGDGKIVTPVHSDFVLGTSNFTIEFWSRPSETSSGSGLVSTGDDGTGSYGILIGYNSSGNLQAYGYNTSAWNLFSGKSLGSENVGVWTHYAVTRQGSTFRFFANGVLTDTATNAGSVYQNSNQFAIGAAQTSGVGTPAYIHGNIQDFRYYNHGSDAPKYTAAFKPPTRNDFSVNNLQSAGASGTMYSEEGTWAWSPSGPATAGSEKNAFDGNSSTYTNAALSTDGYIEYTFPSAVTVSSKLEVDYYNPDGYSITSYYKINSEAERQSENPSGNSHFYSELKNSSGNTWTGSLTKIKLRLTRGGGSTSHPVLYGIKVDGNVILDGTAATGKDSLTDSPTNYLPTGGDTGAGGEARGNFCTMLPTAQRKSGSNLISLSQGNLKVENNASAYGAVYGSMAVHTSGKWYFECKIGGSVAAHIGSLGLTRSAAAGLDVNPETTTGGYGYGDNGYSWTNGTEANAGWDSWVVGDVIGVKLDLDSGTKTVQFLRNNTSQGTLTINDATLDFLPFWKDNTNDSTTAATGDFNFGQRAFKYSQTGYKSWCTANLPDTFSGDELNNPSKYFDIVLRNGFGSSGGSVTGLAFQPDFIWEKTRSLSGNHNLFDAIRGASKYIQSNTTGGEGTAANYLTSFDSNGFTMGSADYSTSDSLVNWCWDAGTEETAYAKYLTGGIDSNFPAINAFDGSLTSDGGVGCRTTQGGTMTFEPPTDIAFTKLRIYANNDNSGGQVENNTWKVNGTDVTSAINSGAQTSYAWIDVTSSVSSPLDKIEVISNSSGGTNPRIQAIEINDVILTANGDGVTGQTEQRWTNRAAGFSICKYTGTGADATIGHDLGEKPDFMIFKELSDPSNDDWSVYHKDLTNIEKYLELNDNVAEQTYADEWNETHPTNTVAHIGAGGRKNESGNTNIMYCWAPIAGYSAFGKWNGTEDANGPYIYTGFRPRWFLTKPASVGGAGKNWLVFDSKMKTYNPTSTAIILNSNDAEVTGVDFDFLSNGVKVRTAGANTNPNGATMVWAAFAEHPFKTARAK